MSVMDQRIDNYIINISKIVNIKQQTLIVFCFLLNMNFGLSQTIKWEAVIDSATVFSSPRFVDLNGDNILDIVVGAGLDRDDNPTRNSVVAIDGLTGNQIWQVGANSQVYTSALFEDITNDGIPDVFIGGRFATFLAINGSTGQIIWEFWEESIDSALNAGWFNFYSTELLQDLDQDGYRDLLLANGGDARLGPTDSIRPTGKILILSGLTGNIIAMDSIPQQRETYYAPHVHDNYGQDSLTVVFGSGGETLDGKLWEVSLTELLNNNISQARVITIDTVKGFVGNSGLTDLNSDGILDIISIKGNGSIAAINGLNHAVLWESNFSGYEAYVAPTIGYFNSDNIPDIFTVLAHGVFPSFDHFKLIFLDGSNGQEIFHDSSFVFQYGQGLAVNLDADPSDELLYLLNEGNPANQDSLTNRLVIIDPIDGTITPIGPSKYGASPVSTPSIVDLDNDGIFECVYIHQTSTSSPFNDSARIVCLQIDRTIHSITWPGYLGPSENGILENRILTTIYDLKEPSSKEQSDINVYPNPTGDKIFIDSKKEILDVKLLSVDGKYYDILFYNNYISLDNLPSGIYIIQVLTSEGKVNVRVLKS
jgi:outer membrane protein assembly factor BamB